VTSVAYSMVRPGIFLKTGKTEKRQQLACDTAQTGAHGGTQIVVVTRVLSDTTGTTTGKCFILFLMITAMKCPN